MMIYVIAYIDIKKIAVTTISSLKLLLPSKIHNKGILNILSREGGEGKESCN